jgi:formylglycine-generating enzyme required for sulfatase activity
MSDSTEQIAALELALAELSPGSSARAGLEAMLQQLRAAAPPSLPQPEQSGGVRIDNTHVDQIDSMVGGDRLDSGDKVLGDKHEHYYGGPRLATTLESLLATYLASVIGAASHLTLAEMDNADLEQSEVLLEDVYTRLEVASAAHHSNARLEAHADSPRPEETQQLTAIEALVVRGRLVLLGPPGSGKSTLTRFLALCLARAAQGDTHWLNRLGDDWTLGQVLPIRVELSDFAAWITLNDQAQGAELLLWDYLAARYPSLPGLAPLLRERAQRGEALLLLDGLDEVSAGEDGQPLRRVRAAIQALAADTHLRHILVTCRVLDYEERRRQLLNWPVERLIPFAPELQREFIDRWYQTLKRLQRPLIGDPDDLRRLLREAIGKRPDLRRLAGNPLLLTMMALLHASKGRLPEKRAELYAECLDLLLRRWRRGPGRPSLEERLGLPGWDTSDTDRLLNHLGYVAHSQERQGDSEGNTEDERTGGAALSQEALITTAAQVFKLYRDPDPFARAEQFCKYVGQYSNGVLQQHGPDSYRFPHRTFQEFLAARRLVDDRDWHGDERDVVTRLRARAQGAQWREVLLLAVSQLILQGKARSVASLVGELLKHRAGTRAWAEWVVVAGEVLTQAERKHFDGVGEGRLWVRAVDALKQAMAPSTEPTLLARLSRQPHRPLLNVADRVRAGMALSLLGDPRLGITSLEPQWCEVPAGSFILGSQPGDEGAAANEQPQRTVELPGFRVARYPVTNAQWQQFLEAGGYRERRWWSAIGWHTREQVRWTQPGYWDDVRLNDANRPVVGVSWYEALAFCRWLSAELGYSVRLPSEAEWEKAARGDGGLIFPWGNSWDAARANTEESGIGATTPVGCFPDGVSPYGVLDMSGNVFEWTATPWTRDYQESDGTGYEAEVSERFCIRGGGWSSPRSSARCAYRIEHPPTARYNYLGFRVIAALPFAA